MKESDYKILVVEDSMIEKRGYEMLLSASLFKNAGYEFIGCVESSRQLFDKIRKLAAEQVDFNRLIILLDIRLNKNFLETEGLNISLEITIKAPGVHVILNSKSDPVHFANKGLPMLCNSKIVHGFITKDRHNEVSLLKILNKVRRGEYYFDEVPATWVNESFTDIDRLKKEMIKFYLQIYGIKLGAVDVNKLLPKFRIEWCIRQKLELTPLQWNIFLWIATGRSKQDYLSEFDIKGGHFDVQLGKIRKLLDLEGNKNDANFLLIGLKEKIPSLLEYIQVTCELKTI